MPHDKKMCVLVVDDDELDFRSVKKAMIKYEPTVAVTWCNDKKSALKALESEDFDLAFVDLNLGIESGMDIIRGGSDKNTNCLFIAITGSTEDSGNECLNAGASDFIFKSELNSQAIRRTVNSVFQKNRLTNTLIQQQHRISKIREKSILGELCLSVAHEVNNPLAALMGRLSIIARKLESGDLDVLTDLEKATICGKRIKNIVDEIRLTTTETKTSQSIEPLSKILKESIDVVRHRFEMINGKFVSEFEAADDIKVSCDANQIVQVLVNLFTNAIEAVVGQNDRKIGVKVIADSDGWVAIEVSNPGTIPKRLQEKILGPYFTTKSKSGGNGIGLSISKSLVQKHGGTLEFTVTDQETRFIVRLPVAKEDANNLEQNILVVDDDQDMREMLVSELKATGFPVSQATNGLEALEIISEQNFDLVVCDIQMPIMDGITLFRSLKEKQATLPRFIFVTGFGIDSLPHDLLQGQNKAFSKPFNVDDLVEEVRNDGQPKGQQAA